VFEVERGDQSPVWLETGRILFSVQIGSDNQAGLGTGSANEVEHFFVAGEGLGGLLPGMGLNGSVWRSKTPFDRSWGGSPRSSTQASFRCIF
jgi:hypothetical protein